MSQVYYKMQSPHHEISAEYETKGKETKKGNKFTTKCKVHNYGICVKYETKEKETKKGNTFTTKCKAHMELLQNIRQRKKRRRRKTTTEELKFTNTFPQHEDWGIVQSSGCTPLQCLWLQRRHVILCDANQLPVSFSACGEFRWHYPVQVQCCFMSTETIGTFRDGEPRMATLTFTQLLGSDYSFTAVHFMSIMAQFLGAVSKSWIAYAPCHIACAVCLVKSYSYDKK